MSGRLGNKAVIKFSYRVESKPSAYFNKSANTVPCNSLCLASIIQRVNRKRCVPNGVPNWGTSLGTPKSQLYQDY